MLIRQMFVFIACWSKFVLYAARVESLPGSLAAVGQHVHAESTWRDAKAAALPGRVKVLEDILLLGNAECRDWLNPPSELFAPLPETLQVFVLLNHAMWKGNGCVCLHFKRCGKSHVWISTMCDVNAVKAICQRLALCLMFTKCSLLFVIIRASGLLPPCCYLVVEGRLECLEDPVRFASRAQAQALPGPSSLDKAHEIEVSERSRSR